MSKADEMFKELGYKKYENHPISEPKENQFTTQDNPTIEYIAEAEIKETYYSMRIIFMLDAKRIQMSGYERGINAYRNIYHMGRNPILNMQELQAINEKVKELQWI